ncbi:MAG: hypothetical protein OJF62_003130 [Pseudolabrys sp.]|jgi:hypothetical protein|nr:hypothetical protein [Pseudolabrys sp.]
MSRTIKIAPPNSLLCISGSGWGETPEMIEMQPFWATPSCILVACLCFADGQTSVTFGPASDVNRSEKPLIDMMLDTPERDVVVATVELEVLLKMAVPSTHTRVRVWTNREQEPDQVTIGIG